MPILVNPAVAGIPYGVQEALYVVMRILLRLGEERLLRFDTRLGRVMNWTWGRIRSRVKKSGLTVTGRISILFTLG